jgi:hypothetical protein
MYLLITPATYQIIRITPLRYWELQYSVISETIIIDQHLREGPPPCAPLKKPPLI